MLETAGMHEVRPSAMTSKGSSYVLRRLLAQPAVPPDAGLRLFRGEPQGGGSYGGVGLWGSGFRVQGLGTPRGLRLVLGTAGMQEVPTLAIPRGVAFSYGRGTPVIRLRQGSVGR